MNKYFKIKLGSLLVTVMAILVYSQMTYLQNQLAVANETITTFETAGKEMIEGASTSKTASSEGNISESSSNGTQTKQKHTDGKYTDGTYEGSGVGFGGNITVSVTISGGSITEVKILSADDEDKAYLDMAKELTSTIVSEQTTEIDVVSGATFSSNGILEAVNNALEKAV